MEDKEALKLLSEIRDEMREMNEQIKWLKNKATEAIERESRVGQSQTNVAELGNKKSKKDLLTILAIVLGLGALLFLEKLGYL
ncbi:hypothetical protein [Motilimonas sp. KMU-193]|uniref:hypothetical protein n=1 Tax=Motilimonas sp. KMU-193 TaxID=3388668 RepID=UPI00396B0087